MRLILVVVLVGILVAGCQKQPAINEGIIEFKVSYPELDSNNVLLKFMPQRMTMVFKDRQYKHDMRGGMGVFRTGFIHNSETELTTYFLKLINVKYKSVFTHEGLEVFNADMPKFNVIPTEETITRLGLECHKVLIDYINEKEKDYAIFYTHEIDQINPNSGLPFKAIPGVMMNFEIEQYDLKIRFEAIELIEVEISPDEFLLDDDYEEISNASLKTEIKRTFISLQL